MRCVALIGGLILGGHQLVSAQETFILHYDSVQNGNGAFANSIEEVPDGYLLFGQQFSHDGTGAIHIFVRKLDLQGQFQYEHEFSIGDTMDHNIPHVDPVCLDTGGGFAATICRFAPTSTPTNSMQLFRFDPQGDTIRTSLLMSHVLTPDTIAVNTYSTIRVVPDGFLSCGFYSVYGNDTQGHLVRTSSNGDTLWTRKSNLPGSTDLFYDLAQYYDQGFLITGTRLQGWTQDNDLLIRTDSNGNQIWRRQYGEDNAWGWPSVVATADSGIVTWSTYKEDSWANNVREMLLTKWNSAGSVIWQKRSHHGYDVATFDIEVLDDGSFICSGTQGGARLAKFSADGDSIWSRVYYAFYWPGHEALDVLPSSDGGFAMCGWVSQGPTDLHPGMATQWVVKTDSFGCVVPGCQNVGVQEYELGLQEHLVVSPNPAHDRISFSLELPNGYAPQGAVRAVLLDASGRQVIEERVERSGNSLSHAFTLAPGTPSGLYYLHLQDERRWLAGSKVVVE